MSLSKPFFVGRLASSLITTDRAYMLAETFRR